MREELAREVARIYERATNETLALLRSTPAEKPVAQTGDWMSAIQLAEPHGDLQETQGTSLEGIKSL